MIVLSRAARLGISEVVQWRGVAVPLDAGLQQRPTTQECSKEVLQVKRRSRHATHSATRQMQKPHSKVHTQTKCLSIYGPGISCRLTHVLHLTSHHHTGTGTYLMNNSVQLIGGDPRFDSLKRQV